MRSFLLAALLLAALAGGAHVLAGPSEADRERSRLTKYKLKDSDVKLPLYTKDESVRRVCLGHVMAR